MDVKHMPDTIYPLFDRPLNCNAHMRVIIVRVVLFRSTAHPPLALSNVLAIIIIIIIRNIGNILKIVKLVIIVVHYSKASRGIHPSLVHTQEGGSTHSLN